MARIEIDLPEQFLFSTQMQVRFSNLNMGNHLGADQILPMATEAQMRFLSHLGYELNNIEGAGTIMVDSAIVYKSQAFYGQTLEIEVGVRDFSKYGCDFLYRISVKDTGEEVARVKTGTLFFDYEKQKPHPVPPRFLEKIAGPVE